jgi:hypothetical protein
VSTPERGLESQLRNIERDYGHSIDHLVGVVAESGLTKHPEVVAMLKTRFGMAHGAAHRVSLTARERLGLGASPAATPAGGPAAAILEAVRGFGPDVEEAPKKGYVSLRRSRQFAMVQPGAKVTNVGLILPGVAPERRLEASGTWNALFTHRVRVSAESEVDAELIAWLRQAYSSAG